MMNKVKYLQKERIIYTIGIILLCIWFGASGYLEITKNVAVWDRTIQMGYPPYFITTLGVAKLLGVLVLLIPKKLNWMKEWVFAAFFFDVIFAVVSGYSFAGISETIKPVVAFVLILITYVSFRKIYPSLRVSLNS